MTSLESWWWPKRPARVPRARTAGLLAGLGAALFGVSAVLLKTGTLGWDESLFRLLNEVPAAAASILTPLSRLFLPAGIITVVALAVVYVLARNHSILPVVAGAAAAGVAWLLAHVAKAIADRPRPYQVTAAAVLRQQLACAKQRQAEPGQRGAPQRLVGEVGLQGDQVEEGKWRVNQKDQQQHCCIKPIPDSESPALRDGRRSA